MSRLPQPRIEWKFQRLESWNLFKTQTKIDYKTPVENYLQSSSHPPKAHFAGGVVDPHAIAVKPSPECTVLKDGPGDVFFSDCQLPNSGGWPKVCHLFLQIPTKLVC